MMIKAINTTAVVKRVLIGSVAAVTLYGSIGLAIARPTVGLVLGGGGARGFAHIGVLEVLREQRIPVDCVAGTSMGGLVTGVMAVGLSPEEMLSEIGKADWRDMFKDTPVTSEINPQKRYISRRFIPGTEMGVTTDGTEALPGVLEGQKIKLFFNKLVRSQYGSPQIESLPLPVSIISTDLVTGDKVVFREGSVTKAMRASMSVPGLMAPYPDGGRLLVDGGLVDNVPIDEVRARCNPDVVIAVNVGSPLMKAKDIGGIFSVAGQMVNILTEQNVVKSLATLKQSDIYIKPDLDGISAGDFMRSADAAKRGRAAAEAVLPQLQALRVDDAQYSAWLAKMTPVRGQLPVIDAVEIAGLKQTNPKYVDKYLRGYEGAPLDVDRVDQDLGLIYGTEAYSTVDYALIASREKNILRVTPLEKSFGPDFLRFGFNIDSATNGPSTYNLRVAYDKTWLNSLGGEWITGVQLGNNPAVFTEIYQPLDTAQRFFVQSKLSYQRVPFDIYQNNKAIAQYRIDQFSADLMGGLNVGVWGPVSAGWIWRQRGANLETGAPVLGSGDKNFGGFAAQMYFDQFDRLYAPMNGWMAKGAYFNNAADNYSKAELDLRAAKSAGSYVFLGRLYGAGSPTGTLPFYDAVSLGGFLNLSGFARGQIVGDSLLFGQLRAEKIVGELPLGLRGDMRVGLALEAGKVNGRYTETELNGWQSSVAAYVGGETPIGVVYIGYGYSPNGLSNIYLFLGTP